MQVWVGEEHSTTQPMARAHSHLRDGQAFSSLYIQSSAPGSSCLLEKERIYHKIQREATGGMGKGVKKTEILDWARMIPFWFSCSILESSVPSLIRRLLGQEGSY